MIYKYKKITDEYTTYTIEGEDVIELCTIDDETYIMADEFPETKLKVVEVELTDDLKAQIKKASPQLRLTQKRMDGKESEVRYSEEDEVRLKKLSMFFDNVVSHVEKGRLWASVKPTEIEKEK